MTKKRFGLIVGALILMVMGAGGLYYTGKKKPIQTQSPLSESITPEAIKTVPQSVSSSSTGAGQKIINVNNSSSEVISRLTSSKWLFSMSPDPTYPPEGYQYQFFQNGSFTYNVISDFTENLLGKWSYRQLSKDDGLLYLLWQDKQVNRSEVLYFKFITDKLQLAGRLLNPVKISDEHLAISGEIPVSVFNEKDFAEYIQITSLPWNRVEADKDEVGKPDYFSFHQDGTFTAKYRNGECFHNGYWSLTKDQIILEMPANHCDLRGNNNPFLWGIIYSLENNYFILDQNYTYIRAN